MSTTPLGDLPDHLSRFTIDPDTGCWNWDGHLDRGGYGKTYHNGSSGRLAHRMVFEALVGPIPPRLLLDHLCRNRRCVNPEHLEDVEHAENVRRGLAADATRAMFQRLWQERTHCARGHELARVGVQSRRHSGYTIRQCNECVREDKQLNYQRVMADPQKAARRREGNRQAQARRRTRLQEALR